MEAAQAASQNGVAWGVYLIKPPLVWGAKYLWLTWVPRGVARKRAIVSNERWEGRAAVRQEIDMGEAVTRVGMALVKGYVFSEPPDQEVVSSVGAFQDRAQPKAEPPRPIDPYDRIRCIRLSPEHQWAAHDGSGDDAAFIMFLSREGAEALYKERPGYVGRDLNGDIIIFDLKP